MVAKRIFRKGVFLFVSLFLMASCTSTCDVVQEVLLTHEKSSQFIIGDKGELLFNNVPFSGRVIEKYDSNKIRSTTEYCNGVKHGLEQAWFSNGKIESIRSYHNGQKVGTHEGWFANGQMMFQYYFENGISTGEHKEWYSNGQLNTKRNYKNGHEFGKQVIYWKSGVLRANYVVREDGRKYGLTGIKRCTNLDTEKEVMTDLGK